MDLNLRGTHDSGAEHSGQTELFDSLQAIEKADNKRKVTRGINILLIITGLQYIGVGIYTAYDVDSWLTCETCSIWSYSNLLTLYSIVHTPVACYLLFKGKRLGWILSFVYDVAMSLLGIWQLYACIYYWRSLSTSIYLESAVIVAVTMLLMAAYMIFLWKPAVTAYFNISPRTKRNMLVAGIFVGLMVLVIGIVVVYWRAR
jgi:hypothetical protein